MVQKVLWLLLALLFFGCSSSYKSTAEELYEKQRRKNRPDYFFRQPTSEEILNFHSGYFDIIDYEEYIPYNEELYSTSFSDSIENLEFYSQEKYYMELDSLGVASDSLYEYIPEYIGGIDKMDILKYEKRDSIEAFLYVDYTFYRSEICIAYSEDNGENWEYYYTGIVRQQPLDVKWYSEKPLIIGRKKLQIEAALLKRIRYGLVPIGTPCYEIVKDGLGVVFDIDIIGKDSDDDGLSDLLEDRLLTDKLSPDTNNNGIPDNLDTNPRVNYPRTEFSKVYEAIVDDDVVWDDKVDKFTNLLQQGKLVFRNEASFKNDSIITQTVVVVSDNKDLLGIIPKTMRIIFMTQEEYEANRNVLDTELKRMWISPLFKVDNKKNTYKINVSGEFYHTSYLIKKTRKGWNIGLLFFVIE